MSKEISKQEYLKRYLDLSKDKKKKHKKRLKTKSSNISSLRIIDQDIDIKSIELGNKAIDELDDEEEPVIAEVIDERPLEVKVKELYESSRWKKINSDENSQSDSSVFKNKSQNSTFFPAEQTKSSNRRRHDSDSDISSPKQERLHTSQKKHDHVGKNLLPIRKSRHDSDSDISPPRNLKRDSRKRNSSSDLSPPRQKNSSSDVVHSRRSYKRTKLRNETDSDISPPRHSDRMTGNQKLSSNQQNIHSSRLSKKTNKRSRGNNWSDSDSDLSPPRSTSSKRTTDSLDKRPKKTLSGLKAGLQDSGTLRREAEDLRKREKTQINLLDDSVSGRNAETIVRDRSTGLKRDINQEKKEKDEENKRSEEHQKKYTEWGKGLVQTQTKMEKFSEDLYEMSKPLARYADDEDLDKRLKAVIHDEDPMSAYIRKKKEKEKPAVPVYSGPPAPPNRFGIPPGYRWDGVDRSNGFEKRYFEKLNSTKASQEESYLWSIQDM